MTQTEILNKADTIAYLNSRKDCETRCRGSIVDLTVAASKEDAIAFGEWLGRNVEMSEVDRDLWHLTKKRGTHKLSELYDIYSADKNKEGI